MATGCPARVVAVRTVDRIVSPASKLNRLIARTLGLLEMPPALLPAVLERLDRIDNRYLGKGYRDIPAAASQAVAALHAHSLVLEPVFTGKAMACLLDELPDAPRRRAALLEHARPAGHRGIRGPRSIDRWANPVAGKNGQHVTARHNVTPWVARELSRKHSLGASLGEFLTSIPVILWL